MNRHTGRTVDSTRNDLDSLEVLHINRGTREIYVSSDSPETPSLLKSIKIQYLRTLESAHT